MALMISMVCSATIFLFIIAVFNSFGKKNDWKKKRIDGLKNSAERSIRKNNEEEKKVSKKSLMNI